MNYVANELYTSLSYKTVYPFLSSLFEVNGVKYVPVSPSDKICDAIDCNYDGTTKNINIGQTVSYKGVAMTVKDIHTCAVYGMAGLKSVTVANQGDIGQDAFRECSINGDVTISNQGDIGQYAFSECSGMNTVTLSNKGVIGNYAFAYAEIKKKLNIANTVTNIGDYAFNACSKLPYATIDHSGKIGSYAFQNCKELGIAGIGGKVTEIGNSAFDGCSKLQWISLPNAVTTIGGYAFQGCTSMTSVKMGTGVKRIVQYVFSGCSSLKELQIGSKVESIENSAFRNCSALPDITIPKSVTSIGDGVFTGCTALKNVVMEDGDEPDTSAPVAQKKTFTDWTSTNKGQINSTSSHTWTFNVKSGDVLTFNYSVSSESGYDKLTITLNGTSLVEASGERSNSVTKTITTSGTATLVAKYTKDSSNSSGSDQAKVYNIKLNGSNQYEEGGEDGNHEGDLALGSNGSNPLFSDCPLDSVYIGRNISYQTSSNYGYSPFYRNTSLRSIHISDIETEVSPNEFYGCTNLKNVRLGDGITTIGDWAFSGCSSIDYFLFGNKTKSIGKEAFSDCTAMTRLISRAATPPTCGDQALDDINKWNCTLEIPVGSKATYQAAPQWKEFFFMEEGTTGVGRTGNVQSTIENCYDLNGRRLVQPQKGLNILRMNDGTVKKVMVK